MSLLTEMIDADSRNIEELHVEKDPEKYNPRMSDNDMKKLEKDGYRFKDYDGMMIEMDEKALVIDDISHYESEELIKTYKPDIFCAGIKEKYVVQKMGVPLKQLHSYDYGGPYAGFKGAMNFFKEIDRMVNSNVWSYIKAPWEKIPELIAKYAWKN
jgi:nitrogenase molybdenum-iron protein alpha chain